ncbi:ABC transporter [Delphinella strobiligena]|nr:ABC transporter [Delphinella strobiligena]
MSVGHEWVNNTAQSTTTAPLPIVKIEGATFYRHHPSAKEDSSNTPIFPDLTFYLANNVNVKKKKHWAIVSPASLARTTFLHILNNQYLSIPPTARSYPFLLSDGIRNAQSRTPERAIKYVGFDAQRDGIGGTNLKGAHLSARYEARKEETDWSLKDYLEGNTELNPLNKGEDHVDRKLLDRLVSHLRLEDMLVRPVSHLSNGQTRRARIAKSLLSKPELLLLDGPFMGLDPPTVALLSALLRDMAEKNRPRIVLSLRPEDVVPQWINNLVYITADFNVLAQGEKERVFAYICDKRNRDSTKRFGENALILQKMRDRSAHNPVDKTTDTVSRDAFPKKDPPQSTGEALVEMRGVQVSYGPLDSTTRTTVLGAWHQPEQETPGLHWSIHRGQRWGIFGPNGSGKTTLLSLITSDHPQTYSLPIKLFGRSRLPDPGEIGISLFELQKRIGHSSPDVHTFFPKHLSLRRVLESAWADAPMAKPKLCNKNDRLVDSMLRWFAPELSPTGTSIFTEMRHLFGFKGRRNRKEEIGLQIKSFDVNSDDLDWADNLTFRDLTFSQQRLALFLRAIVAQPDLVVLDEAFSGIDEVIRDKCLLFLSHGEKLERVTVMDGKHTTEILRPSLLAEYENIVFGGLNEDQALLVIGHSREDVPGCIRQWICLPEAGEGRPARWGSLDGPLELNPKAWADIWGIE